MNYFAGLFVVGLSIYCTISWLIPQLLAWLFKRRYKVDLKIGRIVIHKLILKDVTIVKKGYKIHIEQISFHSSLTNSEVTKLLSIVIRDVRVNKDVVEKKQSKSNSGLLKPLLMKQNSFVTNVLPTITSDPISKAINDINNELNNMTKDVLDFRDMELPTSIGLFTQFLAVKVYNLSVMILRAEEGEGINAGWLCHATAASVRLDGSGTSSYLLLSGSIAEARAKLLRSTPNPNRLQTCLVEVSFGVNLEVSMLVDSPLNVEKVTCSISSPMATLNEGIYRFMQEKNYTIKKYNVPIDVPQTNSSQDSLLTRITPIIPKNFTFKIDGTVLTGVRENSRTDFCASLHTLQINARFSANSLNNPDDMDNPVESPSAVRLPQVYLAFQMDQLKINSNKEKLLFLDKLKLDAKLVNEVLNLYLILKMLTLSYNHDDIYEWFSKYFLPKDLDLLSSSNIIFKEKKSNTIPSWISKFCDICVIQGCAEFWNVSLGGRRGSHSTTLACKGLKVKLDQLSDLRCTPYKSNFASLIVGMRHWSTELLIDSAWLQVGSNEIPTKKHHTWGTGFFVGVALIKWGSHGLSGTKIEAMLDCLRAEGSPMIAKTIINVIECINDYSLNTGLRRERQIGKSDNKLIININLTNVNLFTLTQDNIALMGRIDTISIEKNGAKSGFVISGFKITDIVESNNHYICQRTEEISNAFCFVKLARIDTEVRLYTIELLEIVNINWSANLHLRCLETIKELKAFRSSLREILNIHNEPVQIEKPSNNWSLTFKGEVAVHIKLSENHKLLFNFDDITFARDLGGFSMSWNLCHIAVDDAEIFTIEGVTLERIQSNDKIIEERQNAENFVLNWNKTWGVTILSFRVVFPHKHNFAEAIQDEFVSLTKWIKIVHNYKKKPFTADSPLPSDLCIQIEEFLLEMNDDPFEVKLRDNYELLEDEYKESLKRKTMLDAKVAELCKPHLFLPAGKVEELYAGLNRCNAQIYVQRSRQLSRGTSSRSLSTCRLMKLHILALADPTIHGTVNCVKNLRQIDPDSPWPEEGLEFSTLWCRWISASCSEWRLQLRDFPQPLLCAVSINLWGRLMGTEQSPPPRARRLTTVDQGAPWGLMEIERSMTSLKFYHDLNCEMDQYRYAFGPCWEPIIAQSNLSWEQVVHGSRDPSAPMVWWDKMRLMMHGRLTLCVHRMALLLHASLDPYNTTEEMELAWTDLVLDWTNAKIVFKGDLNVYVRTASKYDDCCLLHLPNLRLVSKIKWLCLADPNDHHCVIQCAPDKIPEYSINQEHDSFRAFRSQGLDIHLSFETRPANENDCPRVLLYGSTLRWFESLKQILSGATRPTRRGAVFNNVRPRKPQLSRHFRNARLSLALHRFQTTYWMSFAKQRGVDVCGQRVTCGAQHALVLTPTRDGLLRRPRATWPPLYINCELNNAEVWFSLFEDLHKDTTDLPKLVRYYCLSVGKVSYGREFSGGLPPANNLTAGESPPTHRLVVHDLRGAWTKTNRDIAFALFDTYMKNKQLKKNLSTEALKIFHAENAESNVQSGRGPQPVTPATPPTASVHTSGGQTQALLAQLVAEAEHKSVVFSDDLSEGTTQPPPHAAACALDDTSHCNWLIALVNAQVVLRGCETKGYVVLCAARAEVRQRLKRSCSTWAGSLQSMQYYATVSARENLHLHENIQWVSVEAIEEKGPPVYSALPDVPSLVGSGHSAGGVLGSTVGPCDDLSHAPQLQRIVSRCTCEFYYVGYEESGVSKEPNGGSNWGEPDTPCDSFTLMHHDLDVCTNSLQYAMLLDVVNNLVLYVEPQRKRALERLARMRFQIQLHRVSDPRRPIQLLQNQVRGLVAKLRHLERETYLIQKAQSEGNAVPNHEQSLQDLQRQVMECKEQLTRDGEELHAMVACYQESRYRAPAAQAHSAAPVRANEIYFKHAQWRLTDADGQLGIADLVLSNFQYTKNTKSDDSVEHLLELGYVRMTNLLPNEAYTEVLVPTEGRSHMPVARQRVLRVFCRERPPVGGISVKEHFEINVVPITIALTKKFFNKMLKFCFPERDPDKIEEGSIDYDDTASTTGSLKSEKGTSKKMKSKKLGKDTNFYVKIEQKDDVEKMKERAEKNKLFIYIKIPEVPVRVSYKGNKEKNLEDLRDISIVIPTLEYHNVTWTWLDLLLAMKSDSKKVIISQALRQKLQLHRNKGVGGGSASPPEEDKARMLLGDRRTGEAKPQKKTSTSTFRFQK